MARASIDPETGLPVMPPRLVQIVNDPQNAWEEELADRTIRERAGMISRSWSESERRRRQVTPNRPVSVETMVVPLADFGAAAAGLIEA
jgi:hypothetical protein